MEDSDDEFLDISGEGFFCTLCLARMNSSHTWSSHIHGKRHAENKQKHLDDMSSKKSHSSNKEVAKGRSMQVNAQSSKNDYKHTENLQFPKKGNYKQRNASAEPTADEYQLDLILNELERRNQRSFSASPEPRSMSVNNRLLHLDQLHDGDLQRDFNQSGAKPKIYQGPRHHNFSNTGHIKNFQELRQDNQSKRGYFYDERKQEKKANDMRKKIKDPDTSNIDPLLLLSAEARKILALYDEDEDEDEDSNDDSDDDWYIVSQKYSNDESDSESQEESDSSDCSVNSSDSDSETELNSLRPSQTKNEAFVSVFWDIENCALPREKSAVNFASYIRSTFYEGRTEVAFIAACDVSNLGDFRSRDLDEAAITTVHVSSSNKNAADKKLVSLLQAFQNQYRKSNSAIVLISSDSDFSPILLDMRYQHHIFINLICKTNTRGALTTAANKFVFMDDILNDLPNQDINCRMMHVLIVENLPKMKINVMRHILSERLKNVNCKLRFCNASRAKIYFKDYTVCVKAQKSLKGFRLDKNALDITYKKEMEEIIFEA